MKVRKIRSILAAALVYALALALVVFADQDGPCQQRGIDGWQCACSASDTSGDC